jgi:hypothetical protein
MLTREAHAGQPAIFDRLQGRGGAQQSGRLAPVAVVNLASFGG